MVSFSQLKDMFRVQREAKKVKKELKRIQVEAEARGVKVVVSADMEVVLAEREWELLIESNKAKWWLLQSSSSHSRLMRSCSCTTID